MRILLIEKVLALALSILQLDFKMTNFEIAQIDLSPEMVRITNLPLISSQLHRGALVKIHLTFLFDFPLYSYGETVI